MHGITLIALVITIIVLLILAAVTINLTIGERGIFTIAQIAARNYTNAQNRELASLDVYDTEIKDTLSILGTGWNASKKVNAPKLADGLTPVVISDNGTITEVSQYDSSWYDYENQKWANAQSKDGSLWVWIPRYAYKIKYTNASDKSAGGTIEVVFLKGTSDEAEQSDVTIKRANDEGVNGKDFDTTGKIDNQDVYIVHPAFCDGRFNEYKNGEWDAEIPGFWMAKFEAGYAGTKGKLNCVVSPVQYTSTPNKTDSYTPTNYYGEYAVGDRIVFPLFTANRPSFGRISTRDSFELCKKLTANNNPYGFTNGVNSHLTKNSEWGAVAYLSYSQIGTNGVEISVNNSKSKVYFDECSITGFGITETEEKQNEITWVDSGFDGNDIDGNWTSDSGKKASTTMNITGIYDMSGGAGELTAGRLDNDPKSWWPTDSSGENSNKYVTYYYRAGTTDSSTGNYENGSNKDRKGEGMWELTDKATSNTFWDGDGADMIYTAMPFLNRGGSYSSGGKAGIFAFGPCDYYPTNVRGFRAVLVVSN